MWLKFLHEKNEFLGSKLTVESFLPQSCGFSSNTISQKLLIFSASSIQKKLPKNSVSVVTRPAPPRPGTNVFWHLISQKVQEEQVQNFHLTQMFTMKIFVSNFEEKMLNVFELKLLIVTPFFSNVPYILRVTEESLSIFLIWLFHIKERHKSSRNYCGFEFKNTSGFSLLFWSSGPPFTNNLLRLKL